MRFVHIAPQSSVSAIRKRGLRLARAAVARTRANNARAVFAVPLAWLQLRHATSTCDGDYRRESVAPRFSSGLLWKWLMSQRGNHRAIAVVFELPASHWPITLSFELDATNSAKVVPALASELGRDLQVDAEELAHARRFAQQGRYEMRATVPDESVLGRLIHGYASGGGVPLTGAYMIQALIEKPVPARCIKKLIPLDQTSKKFKERKSHRWGHDRTAV